MSVKMVNDMAERVKKTLEAVDKIDKKLTVIEQRISNIEIFSVAEKKENTESVSEFVENLGK